MTKYGHFEVFFLKKERLKENEPSKWRIEFRGGLLFYDLDMDQYKNQGSEVELISLSRLHIRRPIKTADSDGPKYETKLLVYFEKNLRYFPLDTFKDVKRKGRVLYSAYAD